jgi:DedD protein
MFAPRSSASGKTAPPQPQSVEAVRRRARHRLIGAAVLVLLGVIGFPLLFDTEPRPISVDIPIEIPAKNTVPSLPVAKSPPAEEKAAKSAPEVKTPAPSLPASESLGAREEVVEPVVPKPAAKVEVVAPKAEVPAVSKVPAKSAPVSEADRAKALLEGKTAEKVVAAKPAEGNERIVVQVGAFAEAAGARTVRLKLERAGLKTYTHVAETPEGKRIRVRVGPFASRAEAEKVAARVKALGLPAAILTL